MKKCKKCGAVQDNDNTLCVDCGAMLGAPISADEEETLAEEISNRVDGMSERCDDFYVSVKDKIFGFVSVALAVASVVMLFVAGNMVEDIYRENMGYTIAFFMGTILFSAWSAVCFLSPGFVWRRQTLRFRRITNIYLEPSSRYLFEHAIMKYFIFAIACVVFIAALWYMF